MSNGDPQAEFADFARQRRAGLVRLCWALTGDFGRGEDLAQAALQRLWQRWPAVNGTGDPWPYLQKIAVSQAVTMRRRRWLGEVPHAALPTEEAVGDEVDSMVSRHTVQRWLAVLPPRQRAVIVLRFLADLSVEQTAERLDCSVGTVKSQTAKALAKLRGQIVVETSAGVETYE